MKRAFDISNFENAFFWFLYRHYTVDLREFHRIMLWDGYTLRVDMTGGIIVKVTDIRGREEKVLYVKGARA